MGHALRMPIASSLAVAACAAQSVTAAEVCSWPLPEGEALCEAYTLRVSGTEVPVASCRVSAMPFNQVWPGYQRSLDQTELAGFACWEMAGPVTVEVQSRRAVQSVALRPAGRGIRPTVEGSRISFVLDRPGPVVLEVNGTHEALHLFPSAPEQDPPAPGTPGLHYFAPGVHRPGKIELKTGESVYIAGGAVVYGSIQAQGASDLRIAGRGVLDVSPFPRGEGGGAIRLSDCSNVAIEGIVMRDPDVWCCSLFGCRRVTIADAKLIGLWRYNADGIDVCNSQEVEVRDCFVRAYDDALVVKGLKWGGKSFDDRPVHNVRFRRCVVWCDWGRALEIGAETCAPEISDVAFENCDIIRTTHIAMDIQHGDRAAVHEIRFENIAVEIDDWNPPPRLQRSPEDTYQPDPNSRYVPSLMVLVIYKTNYSQDSLRGTMRDVAFRNITVTGPRPPSSFRGFDAEHGVDGVTVENLRLNGKTATNAAEAGLQVGPFVEGVRFAEPAAP